MSRLFGASFVRRLTTIAVALMLVTPMSSAGSAVTATPAPPVTLPGHVLSSLATARRVATLPASQPLTLTIALRPRSSDGLQAAVEFARAHPTAPALTPDAIGQLYGQPQPRIDALVAYFQGQGFTAIPAPANHLSFQIKGTAEQVEKSFGVSLGNYDDGRGKQYFATSGEPSLPADVADSIQAIFGLDNYPSLHHMFVLSTGSPGFFGPPDMQTVYNVTPLYSLGYTGAGQTIAIIGCDQFLPSDVQAFEDTYLLPHATITTTSINGGAPGDSPETTLDLEWSGAIATGASMHFYGFDCSFGGLESTMTQVSSDNSAGVVTISLGACENTYTTEGFLAPLENQFAVAAAQKQGVFVASGDSGAYTCSNGAPSTSFPNPTVSYPASSAYVTAVGGTSLFLNNATGGYGSESAWGSQAGCQTDPITFVPCGSGGGISSAVPEPLWQTSAGITSTLGMRGVPDIALNSDPKTGDVIYFSMNNSIGCTGPCGGVGGTSIAAPQWAGIAAIANQAANSRLGQWAPLLYSSSVLYRKSTNCPVYHDVLTGNNLFYNAVSGWDLSTGWGSPNAYNLLRALVPAIPPIKTSTATVSDSAFSPLARVTGAFTLSVSLPLVEQAYLVC